jgi:hypothetical protein
MTSNTLGSPNLGAQVGPVVISEVMYHPLGASGDLSEFVEICNTGSVSESLANWKLRGGADFDFTAGHLLAPGAVLVVVAFDPLTQPTQAAAFRAEYGIALGVPLVGPFTDGPLGNDTGTVRLQRPDSPPSEDPGYYPQVTEDEVIYLSEAPWSVDAAGNGQSLHRVGPDLFGNFASSWTGKPPTPGTGPFDYRNWAANHPGADLSDPAADLDGDGLSNDDERIWGLDPTSGSSNSPYVAMPDAIARTFSYTRRDPVVTGISYTVWTSPDLLTWSEDLGARQEQTSLLNEVETVQVTVSAAPVDGRLFVRVMAVD